MIEKLKVLLQDQIASIHTSFIKDGWLTIYANDTVRDWENYIYCCLVYNRTIKNYKQNRSWGLHPGREGKPAVLTTYKNGREQTRYETYSEKGIEPFIYSKSFNYDGGSERYVDISEEFILYFKLYERGESKQDRHFYYINDSGELDEAIAIKPSSVRVKLKYLMEYLAIRNSHLSVCFEFMNFSDKSIDELGIEPQDEDVFDGNKIYNIFIRPSIFRDNSKTQIWILGKVIISPPKDKNRRLHFEGEHQYAEFITGYDDVGNEILEDCSKTDGKYFVMTYFKKEVLNKYYNDPGRYKVTGMALSSDFFSLKMDNNHKKYVAVFLIELRMLPYKEQLHWKQYNITPQNGMSSTYYRTMIEGRWAERPETPDLFFKHRYDEVNSLWEKKFGWKFYKPLAKNNEYRFTSLHIPTTNNFKSFCEQILSLVIITIDSLNEKEISKGIVLVDGDKGITKLEKSLEYHGKPMPEMIEFLRKLQDLRSGLVAHRFSSNNRQVQTAIDYFGLTNDNYIDVATDIFVKSIYTLNSLEKHFLK